MAIEWDGAKGDFLNVSMTDSHLTLPIDLISIYFFAGKVVSILKKKEKTKEVENKNQKKKKEKKKEKQNTRP